MNIVDKAKPKWKRVLARHKSYVIEGANDQKSHLTNDSFSENNIFDDNPTAQLESIFKLCDQVSVMSDDDSWWAGKSSYPSAAVGIIRQWCGVLTE